MATQRCGNVFRKSLRYKDDGVFSQHRDNYLRISRPKFYLRRTAVEALDIERAKKGCVWER